MAVDIFVLSEVIVSTSFLDGKIGLLRIIACLQVIERWELTEHVGRPGARTDDPCRAFEILFNEFPNNPRIKHAYHNWLFACLEVWEQFLNVYAQGSLQEWAVADANQKMIEFGLIEPYHLVSFICDPNRSTSPFSMFGRVVRLLRRIGAQFPETKDACEVNITNLIAGLANKDEALHQILKQAAASIT